jgi:hypothetical protein
MEILFLVFILLRYLMTVIDIITSIISECIDRIDMNRAAAKLFVMAESRKSD